MWSSVTFQCINTNLLTFHHVSGWICRTYIGKICDRMHLKHFSSTAKLIHISTLDTLMRVFFSIFLPRVKRHQVREKLKKVNNSASRVVKPKIERNLKHDIIFSTFSSLYSTSQIQVVVRCSFSSSCPNYKLIILSSTFSFPSSLSLSLSLNVCSVWLFPNIVSNISISMHSMSVRRWKWWKCFSWNPIWSLLLLVEFFFGFWIQFGRVDMFTLSPFPQYLTSQLTTYDFFYVVGNWKYKLLVE